MVHAHLSALYEALLQQNLARLVEPFSRVEVAHLASLIKLPLQTVLDKLSQVRCPCVSVGLHPRHALACGWAVKEERSLLAQ